MNFNVSVSQQEQKELLKIIDTYYQQEKNQIILRQKDQGMKVLYSTGTLSNFFKSSIFSVQLGYEAVHNTGFALVQEANSTFKPIEKFSKTMMLLFQLKLNLTHHYQLDQVIAILSNLILKPTSFITWH